MSLTATPVRLPGLAAGLVTVIVSVDVPPAAMDVGENDLVTVGAVYTSSVAVAAEPLGPAEVCSAPMGMVLTFAPAVVPVTLTMTVQPVAGIDVPLATVKLPAPAVAVTPAQVPVLPAVPMVRPAGKESVNA